MSWLLSLLFRRVSAHRGVLAVVTALAVVTCAVAGTLTVLVTTAQSRALGDAVAALDERDLSVVADLSFATGSMGAGNDPAAVKDATSALLTELVKPLPVRTNVWAQTDLLPLGPVVGDPMTFAAAISDSRLVGVVEGEIPAADAPAQADGAIPVAVPASGAEAMHWKVGSRITVDDSPTTFVVTGVYEAKGRPSDWSLDEVGGRGYDPAHPLAIYANRVVAPVAGPLLAPEGLLLEQAVDVGKLRVTAVPDPRGLDHATAVQVSSRLADAAALLHVRVGDTTRSDDLTTTLDGALGGVEARLAVTRTGVLAVGLVALVLGGAAALLAARLLIEQRDAERSLMSSRGTSRRQHLLLAVLEAAGIAVVSALLAAPLAAVGAVAVTGWLTSGRFDGADLAATLRSPVPWLGAAACALVLVVLLVTPALRTQEDDAGENIARPAATGNLRAVLSQSAGVVALALVAGVCVWQLASRGTPSADGGTDPVLVAAPALLVLAAGLLVVQALPLVARLTDWAAARSRGLVGPLASWESGRRPARAAGAVLVVTLAVATSVFSLVTTSTWRASMSAQAALSVGAPAVLSDVNGRTPVDVVAAVEGLDKSAHVRFEPAVEDVVDVLQNSGASHQVRLFAVDDASLLRGRLEPGLGFSAGTTWADVGKKLFIPSTPSGYGTPLPDGTTALDVVLTATAPPGTGTVLSAGFVTEDEHGVRIEHPLTDPETGKTAQCGPDGAPCSGRVDLRADPQVGGALRLVGVDVVAAVGDPPPGPDGTPDKFPIDVAIGGLKAVAAAGTTPLGWDSTWLGMGYPSNLDAFSDQGPANGLQQPVKTAIEGDTLTFHREVWSAAFRQFGDGFIAAPAVDGVFPGRDPEHDTIQTVPAVVNQELADELDLNLGSALRAEGSSFVTYEVVGVVKNLPGPTGPGMMVRRDVLQVAEALRAAQPRLPDEWVADVPDARADQLAQAASATGDLRTLYATRTTLQDGPDRIGLQVALWVACGAAVLMAAVGTATTMAAGLRRRRVELARLQALGIPRRALVRAALAEHGILASVGLLGGAATGLLTALLVSRSLAVGLDGRPPLPDPLLRVPWDQLSVLASLLVLLVVGTAVVTARLHVGRARSELLRLGADR